MKPVSFLSKFRTALIATSTALLGACNPFSEPSQHHGPAWEAWRAGDYETAKTIATGQASNPATTSDEALILLALIAHITGDYQQAFDLFKRIPVSKQQDEQLLEATFESLMHLGRAQDAYEMAAELSGELGAGNNAYLPYLNRAKNLAEHPLTLEFSGIFELPFVPSEITDFFPGVQVSINGIQTTARIDTGGAFIHMSPSQAARFGVVATDCSDGFASLQSGKVCIGHAQNLTLGLAKLTNIPVAILDVMENSPLTEIDDSPILGTNILQQFLVTIDAPEQKLIVSQRGNARANEAHYQRLAGQKTQVNFAMWGDHYMIARGGLPQNNNANFFIDSGLVVGTPELGQASILAPKAIAGSWEKLGSSGMSRLPTALNLGPLQQASPMAFIVPNSTWSNISEAMGGIQINALLSYGFLKDYAWTIDFDRRLFTFTKPE